MIEIVAARHPDAADFLRPALQPTADHGHVLIDIDERTVERPPGAAGGFDEDKEFFVLGIDRIEQFRSIRRPFPFAKMASRAARRGAEPLGKKGLTGLAIDLKRERHYLTGVMPWRRRNERRTAGWCVRRREP